VAKRAKRQSSSGRKKQVGRAKRYAMQFPGGLSMIVIGESQFPVVRTGRGRELRLSRRVVRMNRN
jgi:hypothetical protein